MVAMVNSDVVCCFATAPFVAAALVCPADNSTLLPVVVVAAVDLSCCFDYDFADYR